MLSLAESKGIRVLRVFAVYLVLAVLLWWAVRNAPLFEIRETLRLLRPGQIALLLAINALVILCMSLRWWLVVRADAPRIPFIPFVGYRLSVFALSYFTPGPQVGGEPLQILYLRSNHGLTFARAVSAVLIDKLLEFLGNFVFIGIGLFAIARVGLLPANRSLGAAGWIALTLLMIWPALHLVLLGRGRHPISAILRALLGGSHRIKWFRLIVVSEYLAGTFVRRHPRALSSALAVSLVAWTGMGLEYLLMLGFLGIRLVPWEALAGLTASLLAFLLPLPGGLGALEASQVLALGAFGYPAATAISLTLLMRARDLLNGGLGAVLAGRGFGR
ncbi:MAG TPA: lysylphosphatidylglycerol synthase transmembrane domain-containing protein [Anaerolineales bacterium]